MTKRPTEARHPASAGIQNSASADVLAGVLKAQVDAVMHVSSAISAIEKAAQKAADVLGAGGKVAYAGAGSSGLMALADCLELPGTFGIDPRQVPMLFAGGASALLHMTGAVEDDAATAEADVVRSGLSAGDMVICVSASGATPYTLAVAESCRKIGARICSISNVSGSPLLRLADFPVFLDTGAEFIAGSTRLGAASAQKTVLNMISVLVGVRLGHVHDGLMVNVVADNEKLRDRAARIVSAISGADSAASLAALGVSMGAVKTAILIARGESLSDAEMKLTESGGHLAPWLK